MSLNDNWMASRSRNRRRIRSPACRAIAAAAKWRRAIPLKLVMVLPAIRPPIPPETADPYDNSMTVGRGLCNHIRAGPAAAGDFRGCIRAMQTRWWSNPACIDNTCTMLVTVSRHASRISGVHHP